MQYEYGNNTQLVKLTLHLLVGYVMNTYTLCSIRPTNVLCDYKIIHGLQNEFSHLYHLYMTVGINTFTPYFLDDDQNMLITKFSFNTRYIV